MSRSLTIGFLVLLSVCSINLANAQDSSRIVEKIYADIDSEFMSSNINVFRHYSDDAVIVSERGYVMRPSQLKEGMEKIIRAGVKVEISQSKILNIKELRSSVMNTLIGVVVQSDNFERISAPDDKDKTKRLSRESRSITTRVFDTSDPSKKWVIVSQQSTAMPASEK